MVPNPSRALLTTNEAAKEKGQILEPHPNPGRGNQMPTSETMENQMQVTTLDRPPAPRNTHPEDRTEDRSARQILDGWIVQIPRRVILLHSNAPEFGAMIALAVATAWTDRGVPGRPPGGWARLAGAAPRTWQRWRGLAIALGLVEPMNGGGIAPLARIEPGEQFARVPFALLIDRNLSRTAKRVFLGLSLYRSGFGDSRPAVGTLSRASGLNRGNVQKGLRELENRFHITSLGATGRGATRYFLGGQAPQPAPKSGTKDAPPSTESYPRNPQNGHQRCPSQGSKVATSDAPQGPKVATSDAPKWPPAMPIQESQESFFQEGRAPMASDGPTPRGPSEQNTTTGKQASGLQRPATRVAEPPKPRLRSMTDDGARRFFAGWSALDFEAAKRSAEASLGDATVAESITLRAQILDYTDEIERISP